jgi:hypothetical protein
VIIRGDLRFSLRPSFSAGAGAEAEAELSKAGADPNIVCALVMTGGALGAPVAPPKEKENFDESPVAGAAVPNWNGLLGGGPMLFVAAESVPTTEELGTVDPPPFPVSDGFENSSFFVADSPVSGFAPK